MSAPTCPYPHKQKLSKADARRLAAHLSRRPGSRPLYHYACPVRIDGQRHYHVGHRHPDRRAA